jgi:hypothetical protein
MAQARRPGAKHDIGVCTDDNRGYYLCDQGWLFWPADESLTNDRYQGRFKLDDAFTRELEGLKTCPVCRAKLLDLGHGSQGRSGKTGPRNGAAGRAQKLIKGSQ